jgi:preprotein translocase, secA subunit
LFKSITNIFKNQSLKNEQKLVERINALEAKYSSYSDNALRDYILNQREKDHSNDTKGQHYNLLVNVFAVVREAAKRMLGMRAYDVQMLGGIFLDAGSISEMQTGEGKTLVAAAPVVLNAVIGNKVHVVTVNDYLAMRDFQTMGHLYAFLGLSTGLIVSNMSKELRWTSYNCDIVYGTNNEFGFDYLRDNMTGENEEKVQTGLDFVIIDEVDSVLIDEARTPLIISTPADDNSDVYIKMSELVKTFKEDVDFTRDKDNKKTLVGTDVGIKKAEDYFGIESLYSIENPLLLNSFNQALKAHFVFERDKDYVVKDGEVVIIDEFTGRLMIGRRYSDGLHQAIEAKEGVELKQESKTVATITFQNYFRLYKKLSGMTGTAKTEEKEFYSIYKMPVVQIPKNKPSQRIDYPDVVFHTQDAKYKAVVEQVKDCYARKQPILVGTTSISASEHVSALLVREGIPHTVLNAKYDAQEAEIISHAGEIGAVTIATNMAGRGTDIVTQDGVDELGGLFILGTEKHESRRIDNQLKGRTARQGARGETQFYVSLQDDLFKYFGGERLMKIFERFNVNIDDAPIESSYLTKTIDNSQKRIEARNFDIRKNLLGYDDVLSKQREIIYKQRDDIKDADYDYIMRNLNRFIEDIAKVQVLDAYADPTKYPEEWDLQGLVEAIDRVFSLDGLVTFDEIDGLSKDELDNFVIERLKSVITFKENLLGKGQLTSVLKSVLLKITDDFWTNQINSMAVLQEGINFRAYGQLNPLQEYKKEAFAMFEGMESAIKEQFTLFALGFQVQVNAPDEIEEDHSWDGINTIEELEAEVARRQDEIKELLMTPVDNDVNVAGKDGENKNEGERKEEESGEGKEINKENKDDDDEVVLGQI